MKEKITQIKFYHTNKENQPLLDKNNRPYTRINIQTEQHQKTWMSGLAYQGDQQLTWKIGDEVEIETTQNGQYTNFNIPRTQKSAGMNPEVIERLFIKLQAMDAKLDSILGEVKNIEVVEDQLESTDQPPF